MSRIAVDGFIFLLVVPGLAIALAPASGRTPAERLCLGFVAAMTGLYLVSFFLYLTLAPPGATWLLPLSTMVLGVIRRGPIVNLLSETEIRVLLRHWCLFALWTFGLLCLIISPSGAQWTGDNWEHYERARFFLEHLPMETVFLDHYPLTSRPPLANLITASLMELSGRRFSDYQIHTALLATLVFFPGWLFFRRFGGACTGLWTLILMLNPLIAQNTTFSWTKLPTAFLVLTGAHFLAEGLRNAKDSTARAAAFLCLTLGLLTHYSAGPWLLVWSFAYALWCLHSARPRIALRELTLIALTCGLLALTWFGWAARTYGWHKTGEANTTAAYWKPQTPAERVLALTSNVVNTIVPHPMRNVDRSGIEQSSKLGYLRDYWFNIYQLNLPLSAGLGGLAVLILSGRRPWGLKACPTMPRGPQLDLTRYWLWSIPAITVLGIAVITAPDRWGLGHISLQPLVVLGLAWVASRLDHTSASLRRLFACLLCVDVTFGIILHFSIQTLAWPEYLGGNSDAWAAASTLNRISFTNYRYQLEHGYQPLATELAVSPVLVATLLVALLALVLAGLPRSSRHEV